MSVFMMVLLTVLLIGYFVIAFGLLTVLCAIITKAMLAGAVGAPAALFAIFFALADSHPLIIRIIIFFVVYVVINIAMEYKKLKHGMMALITAANSLISCILVGSMISGLGIFIEFFNLNLPDLLWVVLGNIMAIFLYAFALCRDNGKAKECNLLIGTIGSAILYGLAISLFIEQYIVQISGNYPSLPPIIIGSSIVALVIDLVLSSKKINVVESISENAALENFFIVIEVLALRATAFFKRLTGKI